MGQAKEGKRTVVVRDGDEEMHHALPPCSSRFSLLALLTHQLGLPIRRAGTYLIHPIRAGTCLIGHLISIPYSPATRNTEVGDAFCGPSGIALWCNYRAWAFQRGSDTGPFSPITKLWRCGKKYGKNMQQWRN